LNLALCFILWTEWDGEMCLPLALQKRVNTFITRRGRQSAGIAELLRG
jgi:hypothetical protein